MDDHMIDRIFDDIENYFICLGMELLEGENINENVDYKSAAVLIKAHNALVKLYYKSDYVKENLLGSVDHEYKRYLEKN